MYKFRSVKSTKKYHDIVFTVFFQSVICAKLRSYPVAGQALDALQAAEAAQGQQQGQALKIGY